MKAFKILSLIGLVTILLTYAGCKKDSNPVEPVTDVQLGKLTKTWKVNTVSLDGTDRTAEYTTPGFTLVMTGTKGNTSFGYSTSGRPALSPWKSSGSWEFGTDPVTQIIRDKGTSDELNMTYTVTETTLEIKFNFQKDGYAARTGVVKGQWIFNFKL